ncbi:hypothetical protein RhiirA5_443918 [Rhizophagus irregularis]|uniref:Protein kinase domain-containing protein n=1 Tax=Rhizophagus irregularis TaxID=588596 RepID=A0A2N0NDJ8_9GLOM|nr:hypothetical protein RhiirA5_443918 [Rhizophagus irregularis]
MDEEFAFKIISDKEDQSLEDKWYLIVHRDISVVNIFITLNETAKLANFKLSRLTALALIQVQNLERVRYCAPKWLERAPNFNYDYKCKIYLTLGNC